jgi:hypothetical protein
MNGLMPGDVTRSHAFSDLRDIANSSKRPPNSFSAPKLKRAEIAPGLRAASVRPKGHPRHVPPVKGQTGRRANSRRQGPAGTIPLRQNNP